MPVCRSAVPSSAFHGSSRVVTGTKASYTYAQLLETNNLIQQNPQAFPQQQPR